MNNEQIEALIASTDPDNMLLGLTLGATLHSNRKLRSFLKKYVLGGKPVELVFLSDKIWRMDLPTFLRHTTYVALKEVSHIVDSWPYSMINVGKLNPKQRLIHRHITKKLTPKRRLASLKEWELIPF